MAFIVSPGAFSGFTLSLLINLAQLVLFLPVYHFDKFFYTPAENPEQQQTGTGDIFA